MIELKTEKGEFVVLDLHQYARAVEVIKELGMYRVSYIVYGNGISVIIREEKINIGFSEHKLICKLSEATEEDAKGVVDGLQTGYEDYENDDNMFFYALNYLHSLLTSKGIDINNGNWYLFKKV